MVKTVKIATRKSPLAMQQAMSIKETLNQHYPDLIIELLPMETSGDQMLTGLLSELGGKGLFVKELELALLEKRADFAVHSMKDVPTIQPDGLELAVICERDDPRDVFISTKYKHINDLPAGAKVGTASLRRQCQLYGLNKHLNVQMLRGNVNTRLKRLTNGDFDAIILAAAGLKRLGLEQHVSEYFSTHQMLPAAGQGALGIECRSDDLELKKILNILSGHSNNNVFRS
jgi:hydroxymethylbilane synthase